MIMMMRAATTAAAALALSLPLATVPAHAAGERAVPEILPMGDAVSALPVATEDRTG